MKFGTFVRSTDMRRSQWVLTRCTKDGQRTSSATTPCLGTVQTSQVMTFHLFPFFFHTVGCFLFFFCTFWINSEPVLLRP